MDLAFLFRYAIISRTICRMGADQAAAVLRALSFRLKGERRMRRLLRVFLTLLWALSLCACQDAPRQVTSFALDTVCTVTVYRGQDEQAGRDALAEVDVQEARLSRHITGSKMDQLNQDGFLALDASLESLFLLAQRVNVLTDGAFDITLGRISDLWNFTAPQPQIPDAEALEKALSSSGMACLTLQDGQAVLTKDALVDLGGIAKGYIAMQAAQLLRGQGVESAIVNLGGNVVLIGQRPGGGDYRVGVQKPFEPNGTLIATLAVQDCSVVTSGVYQRFFELDGVRYHHVLDPATGYPAQTDLLSATVVCQDAAYADALSTAFLILGKDRALALAQQLEGVEALFVDENMQVSYTDGLAGKVESMP